MSFYTTYEEGERIIREHSDWTIVSLRLVKYENGYAIMTPGGNNWWVTNSDMEDIVVKELNLSLEELYNSLLKDNFKERDFFDEKVIHFDFVKEELI